METVLDTLKIYERLKAADLPEKAAKEIAEVLKETIDESVATKRDMKESENALRRDIKEFEAATTRDLKELELRLKHDLTIRMGVMLTAAVAALAAIVKLS